MKGKKYICYLEYTILNQWSPTFKTQMGYYFQAKRNEQTFVRNNDITGILDSED